MFDFACPMLACKFEAGAMVHTFVDAFFNNCRQVGIHRECLHPLQAVAYPGGTPAQRRKRMVQVTVGFPFASGPSDSVATFSCCIASCSSLLQQASEGTTVHDRHWDCDSSCSRWDMIASCNDRLRCSTARAAPCMVRAAGTAELLMEIAPLYAALKCAFQKSSTGFNSSSHVAATCARPTNAVRHKNTSCL
jgi:hypothetical protein